MNLPWSRKSKKPTVDQLNRSLAATELNAKRVFYVMRNTWGVGLLFVLGLSIYFEYHLTAMVGTGEWKFKGYESFLNIIAGQMFIQIIGLCVIVIRALFTAKK